MSKVVKVAVAAAAIYYGGGALMSSFGSTGAAWGTAYGAGSIGTAGVVGGGLSLSTALSVGGMGLQAMGNIQSRKYQKQGADMNRAAAASQNKANEVANRYRQLQAKRQRLQEIRGTRIRQGQVEGATAGAGLGSSGTSALSGSVGAAGSTASANLGNLGVANDVGNQISGINTMTANYQSASNTATSKATMWNSMDTLGDRLFTDSKKISNLAGKIF